MSEQTKKKRTEDQRAFLAEVKRAKALDQNKLALQPTIEPGYHPVGVGTTSFVNVNTTIAPAQGGGAAPDTTPPAQVTGLVVS